MVKNMYLGSRNKFHHPSTSLYFNLSKSVMHTLRSAKSDNRSSINLAYASSSDSRKNVLAASRDIKALSKCILPLFLIFSFNVASSLFLPTSRLALLKILHYLDIEECHYLRGLSLHS